MANELFYAGNPDLDTGLSLTAKVYDRSGVQVGGSIGCSEVGTTAIYLGNMPAASAGTYLVRFFAAGLFRAQGTLLWDGSGVVTNNWAVDKVEGSETMQESLRLIRAEAAGKLLVSGDTVTIRDAADAKDRITATVDDNGQRTAVTTDAS